MEALEAPKRAGRPVHVDEEQDLRQCSDQCASVVSLLFAFCLSRGPCAFIAASSFHLHAIGLAFFAFAARCLAVFFLHSRNVSGSA